MSPLPFGVRAHGRMFECSVCGAEVSESDALWTWESLDGAVVGGPLCVQCTGSRLAAELGGIVDDLEAVIDRAADVSDWDLPTRAEFLQEGLDDFSQMVEWWREERAPFLADPSPYPALERARRRASEVEERADEQLRRLRGERSETRD